MQNILCTPDGHIGQPDTISTADAVIVVSDNLLSEVGSMLTVFAAWNYNFYMTVTFCDTDKLQMMLSHL